MKNCVIIVAGGSGSRMESQIPKQFLPLEGIPVLMYTINVFYEFDPGIHIIVALPREEMDKWKNLCLANNFSTPHQLISGGASRFHSVKNSLETAPDCDFIAVHDGVRPLVSYETISRCFAMAEEKGSAIPVLPANESVREGTMENSKPLDRSHLFLVQTPQVFNARLLHAAYTQEYSEEFTDDASVVEKAGFPVQMVLGNRENIKITYPEDLKIASLFLTDKEN
jgi:2-C-methyl-D-erythritol 4-phosphate cytidylyltransferase